MHDYIFMYYVVFFFLIMSVLHGWAVARGGQKRPEDGDKFFETVVSEFWVTMLMLEVKLMFYGIAALTTKSSL